jgi:hypothetical protein
MRFASNAVQRGTVTLSGLIALVQTAPAADVSGLFVGGNVGRAQIGTDNALYQSDLEKSVAGVGTLAFTKASLSKRRTAWWVDTGYMLSPYVGIEASYLHFGELHNQVSGSYTGGGTSESVYAATLLSSAGPALGLLFRLPLTEGFDVNFRLADYYGRTNLTYVLIAASSSTTRTKANGSSLLLGLGAAYTFDGHWSAKLDYTRVDKAGNSTTVVKYAVDMLSAGVSYTF